MKQWRLKPTSHYRIYGGVYPAGIGEGETRTSRVNATTVVGAEENPDPQHFEEVAAAAGAASVAAPAPRPPAPAVPTPSDSTTASSAPTQEADR